MTAEAKDATRKAVALITARLDELQNASDLGRDVFGESASSFSDVVELAIGLVNLSLLLLGESASARKVPASVELVRIARVVELAPEQ